MSKNCQTLDIFSKKLQMANFLKKMKIFGNFLTFNWQFSGGSDVISCSHLTTARPIFDHFMAGPHTVTRPDGSDMTYHCRTRSTEDDTSEPETPVWYVNGNEVGSHRRE